MAVCWVNEGVRGTRPVHRSHQQNGRERPGSHPRRLGGAARRESEGNAGDRGGRIHRVLTRPRTNPLRALAYMSTCPTPAKCVSGPATMLPRSPKTSSEADEMREFEKTAGVRVYPASVSYTHLTLPTKRIV